MPELPEVETVCRGMQKAILGKTINKIQINRYDLRKAIPENLGQSLSGHTVKELKRRGKYIVIIFEPVEDLKNLEVMVLHLGMSGRIRIYDSKNNATYESHKHDHVIIHMSDGTCFVYEDPRRFGMIDLLPHQTWEKSPPFCNMGSEPLENWSVANLLAKLRNKRIPIKTALLDQKIVAGLGNIYVCEALYQAKISPQKPANNITKIEAEKIISSSRNILRKAIKAGGSTLRDYQKTDGSLGYFQYQFFVYDKAGQVCKDKKCNGIIVRINQSGRSTFYCPICQK